MVITYKCPGCGAPMVFDPESQKLSCEYCETKLTVKEYEEKYGRPSLREETEEEKRCSEPVMTEEEGENASFDDGPTMDVKKYHCSSCGAEVITDDIDAGLGKSLAADEADNQGRKIAAKKAGRNKKANRKENTESDDSDCREYGTASETENESAEADT